MQTEEAIMDVTEMEGTTLMKTIYQNSKGYQVLAKEDTVTGRITEFRVFGNNETIRLSLTKQEQLKKWLIQANTTIKNLKKEKSAFLQSMSSPEEIELDKIKQEEENDNEGNY